MAALVIGCGHRPRLGRRWPLAAWLLVVMSLGLVAVRALGWETRASVVAALGLLPILLLPAYGVLVGALLRARPALATAALVVVLAHLLWVVPIVWPIRSSAHVAAGSHPLRIFSANVFEGNRDVTGIAEEIRRSRPDVVALIEVTDQQLPTFERVAGLSSYRYRMLLPRTGAAGMALWSHAPLKGVETWPAGPHVQLRGWLEVGHERLRLYVVHTVAPVGRTGPGEWRREMDAIHGALAREHAPLVVIGDFNATDDHRGLRRLLGLGLHDAAVRRGKGLAMTWPRNRRLLPPLVRPDRVLVDRRLAVTGYRLGTGRGSDHRPLVTDLAVPAMPGQATEAAPRYG